MDEVVSTSTSSAINALKLKVHHGRGYNIVYSMEVCVSADACISEQQVDATQSTSGAACSACPSRAVARPSVVPAMFTI